MDRAQQKSHLIAQVNNTNYKPKDVSVIAYDELVTYEKISCTAKINSTQIILLDNQMMDHQVGYRVLAPATCKNSNRILLIDRGWIAKKKIDTLPPVNTQERILEGMAIWPSSGILLKKQTLPSKLTWPLILQKLEPELIESALNSQIWPKALRLDANNPLALQVPDVGVNMPPEKHQGYAMQWFSLALVLMVYYFFNRRKIINYEPKAYN
ncbi:MAG: SURF1 family protein [Francisellaceae bacterium]|nr:SURF1 family protein [Francisellaceae bacterium]